MTRVPVRVRLTAAFALAMVLMLAAAALFVYVRVRGDLDESVRNGLETRAAAVAASGQASAGSTGDREDGSAQVLAADGRVVDASNGAREAAIEPSELRGASAGGRVRFERAVQGVEGTASGLAIGARRGRVIVVVQSLADRDETLSALVASFAIGGPLAVVLASLVGYLLAAAGMRPVETLRRRAAVVSLDTEGAPLPLPEANDELRRLAETLNEMLDRLRRSYEREARFVGDASHELRTPVAIVKTELESALRAGDLGSEAREPLLAAIEETDHLAQLAEDLLIVARTAEGGLPVEPRTLDAAEVLQDVRRRLADRARERRRAIEVDAPAGLHLRADPLRLRQALTNLADNALRHGEGRIVLRAAPAGEQVLLEVSDEGPGFAPELAGRAFERFARGDAARSRGGTGLGLAIVRVIAEAHGGSAELLDRPRGATVQMRLPAGITTSGASKRAALGSPRQPTTTTGGDAT